MYENPNLSWYTYYVHYLSQSFDEKYQPTLHGGTIVAPNSIYNQLMLCLSYETRAPDGNANVVLFIPKIRKSLNVSFKVHDQQIVSVCFHMPVLKNKKLHAVNLNKGCSSVHDLFYVSVRLGCFSMLVQSGFSPVFIWNRQELWQLI